MNNPYFSSTQLWRIPEAAIQESLTEMARDGVKGHEGIVLWLGKDTGDIAEVTHLIRLRGPLIQKRRDFINIDPALLNDVADVAIEQGLRLIGQVHTHGPGYQLDLSDTDHDHGIQAPSYLSLVAPDYGRTGTPVHDWGVHVFMRGAGYVRLGRNEALRRLQLIEGLNPPMLTVGSGS
jgi:proteasome lid subunit RPN8/RPN11